MTRRDPEPRWNLHIGVDRLLGYVRQEVMLTEAEHRHFAYCRHCREQFAVCVILDSPRSLNTEVAEDQAA